MFYRAYFYRLSFKRQCYLRNIKQHKSFFKQTKQQITVKQITAYITLCLMALLISAMPSSVIAQPKTPTIISASGDFENGAARKAALSDHPLSFYPAYTKDDTTGYTATAGDSVVFRTPTTLNGLAFQVNLTRIGSVNIDSTKVNVWGTITSGDGVGSYRLLQQFSVANTASEQVFQYIVNSGLYNIYTNIRITVQVGNIATNSKVRWKAWVRPI